MSDLGGDPPCWAHLVEELSESGGAPDPGWFADLGAVSGSGGAVWSLPHGGDLNANLVRLDASGRIGEHINDDVDVLLFVRPAAESSASAIDDSTSPRITSC